MLYRDGVTVQGTVVENTQTRSKDGDGHASVSYYPVVEFTAQGGAKHRFTGSTGSSVADYQPGATVSVRYDAANPSRAQISDFMQFWLGLLGVGIFGFLFLAGGIGAFFLIKGSDDAFGPQFQRKMAIAFHPGRRILGRSVEIYVDPGNRSDQAVMLEPLLAELQSVKR